MRLYETLRRKMGNLMPKAYVVTPDDGGPPEVAGDMQVITTTERTSFTF